MIAATVVAGGPVVPVTGRGVVTGPGPARRYWIRTPRLIMWPAPVAHVHHAQ